MLEWKYIDPKAPEHSPEQMEESIKTMFEKQGKSVVSVHVEGSFGETPFWSATINVNKRVHIYDPDSGQNLGESDVHIHLRIEEFPEENTEKSRFQYMTDLFIREPEMDFIGRPCPASTLEEAKEKAEECGRFIELAFTGVQFEEDNRFGRLI